MNCLAVCSNGSSMEGERYGYSWSCGPHKASVTGSMGRHDALGLARGVGRGMALYVGQSPVWWGYVTEVRCDVYQCKISDIYNDLVIDTLTPRLRDDESISRHGILSAAYNDALSNAQIKALASPVLRTQHRDLSFGNDIVPVTITGEGPLRRLNRVIYYNNQAIRIDTSSGQIRLGAGETDQVVAQIVIPPFDTNTMSIYYESEGVTTGATLEVRDMGGGLIGTTLMGQDDGYASLSFPTITAGTAYQIRIFHVGLGAYIIPLADYYNKVFNATANVSGVQDSALATDLRLTADVSLSLEMLNQSQDLMGVSGTGADSFIDTSPVKMGDYITDIATAGGLSIVYEMTSPQAQKIRLIDDDYSTPPPVELLAGHEHLVPMMVRRSCGGAAREESYASGFLLSGSWGTWTYNYARGVGRLSSS